MNFAIKLNHNSYYPLCREFLDIMNDNDSFNSLEAIDNFTLNHSKLDIMESLKRSNIYFSTDIMNNELVIFYVDNKKYRELKVYTADDLEYINLDLANFINENITDKGIINQICNYIENKNHNPEELKEFANIIKNGNLIQAYNSLSNLTYYSKRLLKGYIYNKIICKTRAKRLKLK